MFRKLLLLLIFCCGLSTALLAQPRTGPMSGFVYEMQQWRPSYGRYFTINIGYRLNRKAGTKGYEGNNGYR